MKYVDEFRDPAKAKAILNEIQSLLTKTAIVKQRPLQIMEFCGGHTHTIFRYGIEKLLPETIEMVHGPGCPVCVLPRGRVDDALSLAERDNVIFTTFGDAMRVPGSQKSLLQAKADGADIRMVYSPLDALNLARKHPDKQVIFFALGFETTMPSTALTILQAEKQAIENFSLFCNHITTAPTIKAILDEPDMILDGFLAPGHVSMVIGKQPFEFIAEHYHKPIVITGFEPLDILQSIWMVVQQISAQRSTVENQYARVAKASGNLPGLQAIQQVYELDASSELRGLGKLDHSGVKIRDDYQQFDAEKKFALTKHAASDPAETCCGDVIKGLMRPWQCHAFGNSCKPETPLGALMVSSEGACAAYYNFGNLNELLARRQKDTVNS